MLSVYFVYGSSKLRLDICSHVMKPEMNLQVTHSVSQYNNFHNMWSISHLLRLSSNIVYPPCNYHRSLLYTHCRHEQNLITKKSIIRLSNSLPAMRDN